MSRFIELLNLDTLRALRAGVFDSGTITCDGLMKQWVAVRGAQLDWTIYLGEVGASVDDVAAYGQKVHERRLVMMIMPCTEEMYVDYYRH